MLAIRFSRIGRKNYPSYRIIVSEKSKDTQGGYLEVLGHYNPQKKTCDVSKERILYWISHGAKPSPSVHNLFVDQNVIQAPKVKVNRNKKKKAEEVVEKKASGPGMSQNEAKK